jgi:hypothetical protein
MALKLVDLRGKVFLRPRKVTPLIVIIIIIIITKDKSYAKQEGI